jgi:hypothetical protein
MSLPASRNFLPDKVLRLDGRCCSKSAKRLQGIGTKGLASISRKQLWQTINNPPPQRI